MAKNGGEGNIFDVIAKDHKKKFKSNTMQRLSEYNKEIPKLWYPTGIPTLDIALGGGFAGGRASEVFGAEGCGKSTTLYAVIAACQQKFPEGYHDFHIVADPENSTSDSIEHMKLLGVDVEKVFIIAPEEGKPLYAEDIFEQIEELLRDPRLEGRIGIIGIDSLAALVSKFEGEKKDKWDKASKVGGISPAMSMFIRNVVDNGLLYKSQGHLMMLNQVRDDMDSMWSEYRTPGGRKVRHTAAQRLDVKRTRGQDFKNSDYNHNDENANVAQFIGQKIKFNQVKSKVGGKDGATASVAFYYGEGLDVLANSFAVAQRLGIINKSGPWMTFIDPPTGEVLCKQQGENKFKQALVEGDELYEKLDYLLSCGMRGIEPDSVVEEWGKIKAEESESDSND